MEAEHEENGLITDECNKKHHEQLTNVVRDEALSEVMALDGCSNEQHDQLMNAVRDQAQAVDGGNNKHHEQLMNGVRNQALSEVMALDSETSDSNIYDVIGHPCIGSSCSSFTSKPIPPFLLKIYDMLSNDDTNPLVAWTPTGTSFVINNPHSFAATVLPIYFRHNNFQSFITQLNSYGFKKVSWEKWEYKNEYFQRGERHLLRNIKRRNNQTQHPLLHPGAAASSKESETLIKEHNFIRTEITKLKEKQQTLEEKLASLKSKVASNEKDQTRMMALAQRILCNANDHDNARDNENREETHSKGKRKLDDVTTVCSDGVPGVSKANCDIVVDEDMAKHPASTFISLEDLIGDSTVCAEYIRELQEKTGHDLNKS